MDLLSDPTFYADLGNLLVRWVHIYAAILWIGTTAYFSWLDTRMNVEAVPSGDTRVWMVHSGGFYSVEKRTTLAQMPRMLHWWKWEAAVTWITGATLLGHLYYGAQIAWPEGAAPEGAWVVTPGWARAIGVLTLVAGWAVYDLIWKSPLRRSDLAGGAVCFALFVVAAYCLTRVFPGRTAFIHAGGLLGTIMAANVWMRIIPGQKRMVAAVARGETPDPALTATAKQRSKHNGFMAVPVIFTMFSNHHFQVYGSDRLNWVLLAVFALLGMGARKLLATHYAKPLPREAA